MRKRSKALTTLAAFGLFGGILASTASASTPHRCSKICETLLDGTLS